jgi:drug/metabolite transporter (DMT)-like permease
MTRETRGYLLAIGSYASSAFGTIASKWLIGYTSAVTTCLMWFSVGTLVTLFMLVGLHGGIDRRSVRANARVYLEISLIMAVAALVYFIGVDLAGASIVAFVQQLGVVFGVLLGAFVLRERLDWAEGIGGALALAGALVISWRTGARVEIGVLLVVVNALGVAVQNLLVKQHMKEIDKLELLFVRSVVACLLIFTFGAFSHGLVVPKTVLLPAFFFGSLFGYVCVNLLLYQALSHVDLSKVSILSVTTAPMVMVASIFVFNSVPTPSQVVGSALILIGTVLIIVQPMLATAAQRWRGVMHD